MKQTMLKLATGGHTTRYSLQSIFLGKNGILKFLAIPKKNSTKR